MTKLRVLVEIDGQATIDFDKDVRRWNLDVTNGVREKMLPTGPFEEWELDGHHYIRIDYEDEAR